MSSLYVQDALLAAEGLAPGNHLYTTCPCCGAKDKLYVKRFSNNTVGFGCFRASCAIHGMRRAGNAVYTKGTEPTRPSQRYTPYAGDLSPLPDSVRSILAERMGFTEETFRNLSPLWAPSTRRVVYPIIGPTGKRRGYTLRSYEGAEPKSLTRMECDEPHISYYRTVPSSLWCYVVEDIPSAGRVSEYCNAVALNGTGCSAYYAGEIASVFTEVVWALDKDATAQAIRLMRKHAMLFNNSRVLPIEKDFKDMTREEIEKCLIYGLNYD